MLSTSPSAPKMHLEWEACNAAPGWKGFQGLEREEEGRKERRKGLEGRRGAGRRAGEEEEAGATAPRRLRSGRLAGGTHQLPLDHPPWSIPLTSHVNRTFTVAFNILSLSQQHGVNTVCHKQ